MIDINPEKRGDKAKPAISRCVRRLAPVFMRFSRNLMTKTNSVVSAPSQQARRIPLHSYAGEKRDSSRFALRMTCGVILVAQASLLAVIQETPLLFKNGLYFWSVPRMWCRSQFFRKSSTSMDITAFPLMSSCWNFRTFWVSWSCSSL